ncbi:PAS domain S-box-containing protein [Belliella buryatensis]|uniref:histidine kinase n=1 Tax=Belliella buryatensis TaxID=1500549 RepID=A0A239GM82_9BACT|nr:ATP-binding protein [Belliella buryatensis]SNS70376.1 PAS domain S-box-containing protein [Belliella buryatensis]
MKSSSSNILFKYPIVTGILVFLLITGLQYFTVKDYDLKKKSEEQRVIEQANLLEKQISGALANSISTTRVLEYIERNYGIGNDFDSIAAGLLRTNKFIDAIQLVEGGEIKYTYPLKGNEEAIGYNILENPKTKYEALRAIEKRQLYFAGPFELKQGGIGIVGRNPIFKNDEFWGFAAVIIKFDSFIKVANIDISDESPFYIQLSKINPETGEEEFFLPKNDAEFDGFKKNLLLREGDWSITVQLKKSTAFKEVYPFMVLRVVLSMILGYLSFYVTSLPAILSRKVEEQSHEIKLSNERFTLATRATSDAIWDWNLLNGEVYRTDNFEKLFGHPIDSYSGTGEFWISQIHPDDYQRIEKDMKDFLNSNREYWEAEFRFKKADRTYAYVLDKGIAIRDENGKPLRMIGAVEDITVRKVTELELENEREFLKSMMESLSEAIIACDKEGKLILSNRAARELHGENILNTPPDQWSDTFGLFCSDGKTKLPLEEIPLNKAWKGETVLNQEIVIKRKDGTFSVVFASGTPIITQSGRKIGAVIAMKDITAMRSNEKKLLNLSNELALRAKKLEISNSELEQFAYVASHDLQEPLRMITGFLNRLEVKYAQVLDDKAKQYIFFASDGAKRMKQIILDLLEYSKVGNYEDKKQLIQVDQVLKNVTILNRRIIKEKMADITWSEMPQIYFQETPLQQIFQNLIGNAIKYHHPDRNPEIRINFEDTPDSWVFSIKDNGIGIEKSYLEKIFIIFQKLHTKDLYEGSGIGLAICKKIIDKYNGKIWVESTPQEGSIFFFSLPKSKL